MLDDISPPCAARSWPPSPARPMPTPSRPCASSIFRAQRRASRAVGENERLAEGSKRPQVGKAANEARQTAVTAAFDERKSVLERCGPEMEDFDPTLPGRYDAPGSLHPVLQVRDRAIEIFRRLGFGLADGPDIENEVFQFRRAQHAPRSSRAQRAGYLLYRRRPASRPAAGLDGTSPGGRRLLRTQTSTVQIRTMLAAETAAARRSRPAAAIAAMRSTRRMAPRSSRWKASWLAKA